MTSVFAGYVGAFLTLTAFSLLKLRVWQERWFVYNAANFIGGLFLVWYAVSIAAWPFVITNAIWTLFGLKGLITDNLLKI